MNSNQPAADLGALFPNPLIPGFNPDPSVVKVEGVYYLVTSTFEYLPGLPVYRSTDFVTWEQIGNVATRPEQIAVDEVPTGLGVWAPTIRHRDGLFHVIVTVPAGRGCVVFTATDPAGPWSDGTVLEGLNGIDPDLAWDDAGNAYVTFSGLLLEGEDMGRHLGIQQVRVDLESGKLLEDPRSLWSGSGFMFPEAPHLYHRGDFWYLLIAEGGTERGHGVSIARGPSPEGPFEAYDANPFLTARSTIRPIQNTGHGDLVEGPDGGTLLVVLGVRPGGGTRAFSPLGRETFVTTVRWENDWPVAEPVMLAARSPITDEASTADHRWIAVRRTPDSVATFGPGGVSIVADGSTLDDPRPSFIGRRQLTIAVESSTTVDVSAGVGGLAVRYDETHHYEIEARTTGSVVTVVARAGVPGLRQEWTGTLPAGPVTLHLDAVRPAGTGFGPEMMTSDHVELWAEAGGEQVRLARVDGRYLSAETAASFTGRVIGLYATEGTVTFDGYRATGSDS
ncbi:glycoside hydrolase family 43 protein [Kineosporia sp. NBRC 101731]|uniref:glycoside hydrolase family 43 protein n=1 Tax=Kineosporia sp. NBRC 101731 TaxID=3032199 RepID=UPI0024A422F9|nr:glycoside hydrolase family 43 protein [Kineosporia sp. NBRC 101731]GLY29138.1 glycoside hydrolase 43 family protein [Kineosporia sp. NBRC 101731]